MGWSRPPGPPKVWRVEDLVKSDGKKSKFIFQEIPEDRYEEALDHLCKIFLKDELMCSSCKLIDEPESVAAFRQLWSKALGQGISIAAYEEIRSCEKPILAGLNVLVVIDGDKNNEFFNDLPPKAKKILQVAASMDSECDIQQSFKVDRYLYAYGLSVDPQYRGLGLGKHLLEIRNDIGKAYNFPITATLFTSERSQKVASRAGFEECYVRNYEDILDDDGNQLFPSLVGKKTKQMVKRLL